MTEHRTAELQFYLTTDSPCPYLPNRTERKVFTHLGGRRAGEMHDLLSLHGFRRSQNIVYKPACVGCTACQSARVVIDEFEPNARQRRILRKNADLVTQDVFPAATREQYRLFRKYLNHRHAGGGMSDMSAFDYEYMIEDTPVHTVVVEYRKRSLDADNLNPLMAVALIDVLPDGLSMVYSFFDPDAHKRSLGAFMIMDQIARAKAAGLPHLYLGYWVKNSPKMAYKAEYKPLEVLTDADRWIPLED
ncbi:arginyltransferase [Maritalea myrionectae]|uniref:arginyltransferase n=1 Tax=Maritalea myrionectae TaxID=454601 RepID=UPI0003FDFAF7|nr:arginyltransferase [Maritalea myrionectae]